MRGLKSLALGLLLALASLSAFFPAVFGKGAVRFIAAVLLLASFGLALGKYPAFKHEQEIYRERIETRSHDPFPKMR